MFFFPDVFSWFLESAEAYSPFVLIQLICNMLALACCFFQLDLVTIKKSIHESWLKIFIFLAHEACGHRNHFSFARSCHRYFQSLCVLSFRDVIDWELSEDGWMFVWVELAWITASYAEGYSVDDSKYAETDLLSWIWFNHFEFANIHFSKQKWNISRGNNLLICLSFLSIVVHAINAYLLHGIQNRHASMKTHNFGHTYHHTINMFKLLNMMFALAQSTLMFFDDFNFKQSQMQSCS